MKAIKVFLIGLVVWFVSLIITLLVFPIPEVIGGTIVFMGINHLCYTWLRSLKIRSRKGLNGLIKDPLNILIDGRLIDEEKG